MTIERPSLLNIAESYELMEFAGHSACQTKLSFIWNGRLSLYTATWKVFLCVIFPVLLLSPIFKFTIVNSGDGSRSNEPNRKGNRVSDQNGQSPTEQDEYRSVQRSMRVSCFSAGSENKKIPRLKALWYFWTAPVTKFAFNVLSYVAYLSMLSYFMLVELNEVSPSLVEYITWVWLATMIMEEIRQMLFGSRLSLKYRFRNWVRSLWNQFDVALYLIFLVAIALRFLLPPAGGDFRWVRAFYSVALVLSYLRLLQFFYAVKSVGPKVIMIQKMMGDVLLFLSFLLVFLIGFGVAYHINIFPESPPDWYMLVNIVYFPYFQIFGELFLDSMKGEVVDGCETNKTLWRLNPSTRCPEKSPVIMSLMLGVYLIVTNILLVNLLIAMFSNTFQIVQENSLRLWRYNRLSLVHEYFDRPVFAPPIIVLDYIYRVISYVFCCHRWRSRKNDDNRFRIKLSKEEHEAMTLFEKKAMLHSKAAEAPKGRHDLGRKKRF